MNTPESYHRWWMEEGQFIHPAFTSSDAVRDVIKEWGQEVLRRQALVHETELAEETKRADEAESDVYNLKDKFNDVESGISDLINTLDKIRKLLN